ncbi:MAG: carboxypeptidase-like regulatory domain-containing protein [Gemmatimonadota bacterium]
MLEKCCQRPPLLVVLSLVFVPGSRLSPQVRSDTLHITVVGRVVDRVTARGLENSVIRVPELGIHVLSDSTGHFQLRDITPGVFRMTVTCLGYRAESGEFTVLREGSFEIGLSPIQLGPDAEPGRILGRVTAPETGNPIQDAEVFLADMGIRRATSATGWFEFPEIPPGAHVLNVSFLGRETQADTVFLGENQLLEIEVYLPIEPIPVEGITITAYPRWLVASGFFRRRGRNYEGRQWTRGELEEIDPMFLGDLIETIPGIRRVGVKGDLMGRRRCKLSVFVDDVKLDDWFSLDKLDPMNVEALEVYHGDGRPGEFYWYCGVVLVWLKH